MGSIKNHQSVLLKETIEFLNPKPNENFIDATFGDGGHSLEILKLNLPKGKVLGIDWDQTAIENFDGRGLDSRSIFKYASEPLTATTRASRQDRSGVEPAPAIENLDSFSNNELGSIPENVRLFLFCGNFSEISRISALLNLDSVKGILFDLGFRSEQLNEDFNRGFSFQNNGPLDMRYNTSNVLEKDSITAEEIVNEWQENELERIFREYGEEKKSNKIARMIVESRRISRIKSTKELSEIISKAISNDKYKIKTLARIFQALRIAVNDELKNIELGLDGAWKILAPGGRIVVISFHSLEDRIIKRFFIDKKEKGIGKILTKKPVVPSNEEIINNSRSRSAKMRVIEKI